MLPGTDTEQEPPSALMTADELLHYDTPGKRAELVRGRLQVREPAGYRHGSVAARLLGRMWMFLEQDRAARGVEHPLGDVLAAETGFTLQRHPDTVRAPDVAFVAWERTPHDGRGFGDFAPDLAVEILSPGDRPGYVLAKVADWLTAGTSLVWVVDPDRGVVRVYRADGSESIIDESSVLDGELTLPGFSMPVAELFRR